MLWIVNFNNNKNNILWLVAFSKTSKKSTTMERKIKNSIHQEWIVSTKVEIVCLDSLVVRCFDAKNIFATFKFRIPTGQTYFYRSISLNSQNLFFSSEWLNISPYERRTERLTRAFIVSRLNFKNQFQALIFSNDDDKTPCKRYRKIFDRVFSLWFKNSNPRIQTA